MSLAAERVLLVVTLVCLAANLVIVVAKTVSAHFVMDNVLEVGLKPRHVPLLAVLEGLGCAGLVAGLLGTPVVGVAASSELVAFFVVAVLAHLRASVLHSIGFPLIFLALAACSLIYFLVTS